MKAIWRHHWDRERRWRTTVKLGYKTSEDNGSGYFDYNRLLGSAQLRYRRNGWELQGTAKLSYYRYPVQTLSATDPRHRQRSDLVFNVRGERQLGESVKVFVEYDREQTLSNQPLDRYTVNTVNGGLAFEF